MILSDYIQLTIAIVAGIAAILTAVNIWQTNKQVTLQQKQWEHSQTPIFYINYTENTRDKSVLLVLQNTNNVYHHVEDATFSHHGVIIDKISNGYLTTKDEFVDGISISIRAKDDSFIEGQLQIHGTDVLGKEFRSISLPIKLEDKRMTNTRKIEKSYLKKQ